MINKNFQPISIKQKMLLTNIFYNIATLILFFLFAYVFLLCKRNTQDIMMQYPLDVAVCILFLFCVLLTTLGSKLEDAVKKENLKTEILKIYMDSNSIISVLNYAKEKNISLSLIYNTLNDFDFSLFHKK